MIGDVFCTPAPQLLGAKHASNHDSIIINRFNPALLIDCLMIGVSGSGSNWVDRLLEGNGAVTGAVTGEAGGSGGGGGRSGGGGGGEAEAKARARAEKRRLRGIEQVKQANARTETDEQIALRIANKTITPNSETGGGSGGGGGEAVPRGRLGSGGANLVRDHVLLNAKKRNKQASASQQRMTMAKQLLLTREGWDFRYAPYAQCTQATHVVHSVHQIKGGSFLL